MSTFLNRRAREEREESAGGNDGNVESGEYSSDESHSSESSSSSSETSESEGEVEGDGKDQESDHQIGFIDDASTMSPRTDTIRAGDGDNSSEKYPQTPVSARPKADVILTPQFQMQRRNRKVIMEEREAKR